jgi:hypothetical protein
MRSATRYDDTITLAFVYTLINTFFFLVPDLRSCRTYRLSLLRLSLRRLYFCFLNKFKDFLRIKDEFTLNYDVLPLLTLLTYL